MDTIRRAQHRDREAFEMLVEQQMPAVFRLAAAIVGPTDAADVTQETFVAAWQQLPKLRDPEAFAPWLRRICVNRARNWVRDAKRRVQLMPMESVALRTAAPGGFEGSVEARAILESAFERLTVDQRTLLALHYSLGYSIAETAATLGVPTGTAKSRLNVALKALRQATSVHIEVPEAAS